MKDDWEDEERDGLVVLGNLASSTNEQAGAE